MLQDGYVLMLVVGEGRNCRCNHNNGRSDGGSHMACRNINDFTFLFSPAHIPSHYFIPFDIDCQPLGLILSFHSTHSEQAKLDYHRHQHSRHGDGLQTVLQNSGAS